MPKISYFPGMELEDDFNYSHSEKIVHHRKKTKNLSKSRVEKTIEKYNESKWN